MSCVPIFAPIPPSPPLNPPVSFVQSMRNKISRSFGTRRIIPKVFYLLPRHIYLAKQNRRSIPIRTDPSPSATSAAIPRPASPHDITCSNLTDVDCMPPPFFLQSYPTYLSSSPSASTPSQQDNAPTLCSAKQNLSSLSTPSLLPYHDMLDIPSTPDSALQRLSPRPRILSCSRAASALVTSGQENTTYTAQTRCQTPRPCCIKKSASILTTPSFIPCDPNAPRSTRRFSATEQNDASQPFSLQSSPVHLSSIPDQDNKSTPIRRRFPPPTPRHLYSPQTQRPFSNTPPPLHAPSPCPTRYSQSPPPQELPHSERSLQSPSLKEDQTTESLVYIRFVKPCKSSSLSVIPQPSSPFSLPPSLHKSKTSPHPYFSSYPQVFSEREEGESSSSPSSGPVSL